MQTKVEILCPEHGVFEQQAGDHLDGHGCSRCSLGVWNPGFIKKHHPSKMNSSCTLYVIECYSEDEKFIKVGITTKTVKERYCKTSLGGYDYKTLYEHHSTLINCSELEQSILIGFNDYQYIPESKFGGSSECLTYEALDGVMELLDKVWER